MAAGFPDLRVTVTDIGPVMVEAARLRLADQPEGCVGRADVTNLPFDDESFDYVASFLMLHHVVDWPRALAEATRVLRPGGRLFGYDLIKTRLAEWLHWADRSPHRLIALEQLRATLEQLGLEAVRVRPGLDDHVLRFSAENPFPLPSKSVTIRHSRPQLTLALLDASE